MWPHHSVWGNKPASNKRRHKRFDIGKKIYGDANILSVNVRKKVESLTFCHVINWIFRFVFYRYIARYMYIKFVRAKL